MSKDYLEYKTACFPVQFQKACQFRGEKTTGEIMAKLRINNDCLLSLEKGVMQPDLNTLITIANILKLDLCFFFLPDASPSHFDLLAFADNVL